MLLSSHASIMQNGCHSSLVGLTIVSCTLIAIGGFLFGYDQGVMSGILVMPYWIEYFNNPDATWRGFITSIYLLGAFVGGLFAGPLSERIGRKHSIMAATIIFWFGTSMQTGASNVDVSIKR